MDIGVSLLQGLSLYGLSNQLTRTMKVIYIIWQTRKQFSTSARESEKSIISIPPKTHTHTHTTEVMLELYQGKEEISLNSG